MEFFYKPLFLVTIISLSCICSCRNVEKPADKLPPVDMVILKPVGADPIEVTVELAVTQEQQRLGLMYRKSLETNHGMLFIFEQERQLSFWMKNTVIELDMIFIRSDMTVLGCVKRAKTRTTMPRSVPGQSKYVLEVIGGFCDQHKIDDRTRVQFSLPSINIKR